MVKGQVSWIAAIGIIVVAVGCVITALLSPTPNASFRDASAVLALSAILAIGIERTIEVFWTVIGQLRNSYWPLDLPDHALESLTDQMNQRLDPFVLQATTAIKQRAQANNWTAEQVASAQAQLTAIQRQVASLQGQAIAGRHSAESAAAAAKAIAEIQQQYPSIAALANPTRDSINALGDFAGTFRENPGRKLISIFMGTALGLAIAGVAGIDIIHAAAGTVAGGSFHWGVAATGIVFGLGSNPTHELIRSIQEFKQTQKSGSPNPI